MELSNSIKSSAVKNPLKTIGVVIVTKVASDQYQFWSCLCHLEDSNFEIVTLSLILWGSDLSQLPSNTPHGQLPSLPKKNIGPKVDYLRTENTFLHFSIIVHVGFMSRSIMLKQILNFHDFLRNILPSVPMLQLFLWTPRLISSMIS